MSYLKNKWVNNPKFSMKTAAVEKRQRVLDSFRALVSCGVVITLIGVSAKINQNSLETQEENFLRTFVNSVDLQGGDLDQNVNYCLNDILEDGGFLPERFDKDANAKFLLGVYYDQREVLGKNLEGPAELEAFEQGFYKGIYNYLDLDNNYDYSVETPGLKSVAVDHYLLPHYSYDFSENHEAYKAEKDKINSQFTDDERQRLYDEALAIINNYRAITSIDVTDYSNGNTVESVNNGFNNKEEALKNMVNQDDVVFELEDGDILRVSTNGNTNKR